MHCFLVVIPPGSTVQASAVNDKFRNHHEVIPDRVWAVAGPQSTCVEVGEALGIGRRGTSDATGVVVKIGEYNGFFERALWEKINAWETE